MNQVIGIIEWYFFPEGRGADRVQSDHRADGCSAWPGDEAAIAEAMPMARTCFAELDRLLGDQLYFAGE